MGKTVEESLPRNPEEGARMPQPGPQINKVAVLEGAKPLPQPARTFDPQSVPSARDDDRMGGPGSSG
jgi:hypothetical protein